MRFGVCAGPELAPAALDAGYDYLEASVADHLCPELDESSWSTLRQRLLSSALPAEAFNSFVRMGKIVGPEADWSRLERYVETSAQRAAEVGGQVIVFGSGGARAVPGGYEREGAFKDVARFLTLCAVAGERHGITFAIEPLWRGECNFINLVSEADSMARAIGHRRVRVLADSYHMEREQEPLDAIVRCGQRLAHCHTADSGRLAPGTGAYDHAALFRALSAAGYDARLSIECDGASLRANLVSALQHLKEAWQRRS